MKTGKSIIWGFALVIFGILLGLKSLSIIDFNIFFDGWWTLFIIVPCFIGVISDKDKTGSIIGLVMGILLLLGSQDVVSFDTVGKLVLPIILVIVGLSLLFKNAINNKFNKDIKNINSESCYSAIFTGQDIKVDKEFKGTTLTAIFGGIKLDLRNATIKDDVVINCTSIFGGVDIFVPDNVKIEVKSNSVFGGVENNAVSSKEKGATIYIDATCAFGGLDIK